MTRSQDGACADCDPILAQTRSMLQTRLQAVDGGLADPQTFRNRYQNQNQIRLTQTAPVSLTPMPQGTCTPGLNCPGPQHTPAGPGPSSGNGAAGTPGPADNGGPGPGGPQDAPGGGGGNGNGGGKR